MKRKSEIEKLEREKLEPKAWTMQGEVLLMFQIPNICPSPCERIYYEENCE